MGERGLELKEDPLDKLHSHRIPVGGYQLDPPRIPVYVTGDAGGFADAVTGEGIFHALESGRLAGRTAILVHQEKASPLHYYGALSDRVLPDTKISWKLAQLVYVRPGLALGAFTRFGLWRPLIQGFCEGQTLHRSLTHPLPLWLRSLGKASCLSCKWSSINGKS